MEDITRGVEKKVNEGADHLREGVERMRRQGVDLIDRTLPAAEEALGKAKSKGDALWEKAKTKGQDLLDTVESDGQRVWSEVKGYVQKRPFQALGYAIAAGLIIGAVFSPKSQE